MTEADSGIEVRRPESARAGPEQGGQNGSAMQRVADGFRRLDYKSRHSAPARTRRKRQLSPVAAGVVIAIHFSLSDQLATLRRTFDERLIALETGLSDPHQGPSIESLILDLARVAAEEAEAAARDVIRRVRREAPSRRRLPRRMPKRHKRSSRPSVDAPSGCAPKSRRSPSSFRPPTTRATKPMQGSSANSIRNSTSSRN